MIGGVLGALGVAGLGAWLWPTAMRSARLLHWLVALAFAASIGLLGAPAWQEEAASHASTTLVGGLAGQRTAALAAASGVGPRARDLEFVWREPLAGLAGQIGALVVSPPALPFQPDAVRLQVAGDAAVDRPLLLVVAGPPLGAPVAGELSVRVGDQEVLRREVLVGAAPPAEAQFLPAQAGAHRVELRLRCQGAAVVWRGELAVAKVRTVLVLEPSGQAAAALRAQGVQVAAADRLPASLADHAVVVVGQALPASAQAQLAGAVRDGLGAFVLPAGFGDEGAPMRALLPLQPAPLAAAGDGIAGGNRTERQPDANPAPSPAPPPPTAEPPRGELVDPQRISPEPIEVDKRSIAMVLLVDRSGSMGQPLPNGQTKMSYAKTSALRTAQALADGDAVGIVTFGNKDAGRVELPLTDATAEAVVQAGIERLAHGNEFTFLLGGLRVAHGLLQGAKAAVKHVVVVSDGEFDRNELVALSALADRMRTQEKITLSVISIIDRGTEPTFVRGAERLARDGGGQFFAVSDAESVPAFVSAEVTRSLQRVGRTPRREGGVPAPEPAPDAARKPPTAELPKEPPPTPRSAPEPLPGERRVVVRAVAASPLLRPMPEPDWPTLGAAVPGEAPIDAQVLLVAGDEGWPLLAFGNRGLGRVGAFAADLFGEVGAELRAELAFPARLAQWVQAVRPAEALAAPRSVSLAHTIEPPTPTPRDTAVLAAVAGAEPLWATVPSPDAVPTWRRVVRARVADVAPWLVGALVLLVAFERWSAARAQRRTDG